MNINLSEIPTDLILNLLNIVVLYVIVRALVYKPVKRFMQARTDRVTEQNAQAQRLMEQARQLQAENEEKSRHAEEENRLRAAQQMQQAHESAQKIIAQAQAQGDKLVEQAQSRAENDYRRVMDGARKDVVYMACKLSEEILSREINADDYAQLTEEFFASKAAAKED